MTRQSSTYSTHDAAPPRDGPAVAPVPAAEPPARRCGRCGAVGTHYLTCPGLRLPPGYRLSEDPAAVLLAIASLVVPGLVALRPGGGPDHPDWPRPPRH